MQHEIDDRAKLEQALAEKHSRYDDLMLTHGKTEGQMQEMHDLLDEAEQLHDQLESWSACAQ